MIRNKMLVESCFLANLITTKTAQETTISQLSTASNEVLVHFISHQRRNCSNRGMMFSSLFHILVVWHSHL